MESESITKPISGDFLTKEQLAEKLQVDVRTVEQMMHDGAIPFYKLGKKNPKAKRDRRVVRFNLAAVQNSLEQHKTTR